MSGKKSSYQKMKDAYEQQIRNLTDDVIALVEDKDFNKVMSIKTKWRIKLGFEKGIFMGDSILKPIIWDENQDGILPPSI